MPYIYWIFGPNCVGKSTHAQSLFEVEHFNLDKIIMDLVEKENPGLIERFKSNSTETFLQQEFLTTFSNNSAQGEAELYNHCTSKIINKESFSIENNFLPSSNHEIISKAVKEGYKLSFVYVGEKELSTLKSRVDIRTKLTGQFA